MAAPTYASDLTGVANYVPTMGGTWSAGGGGASGLNVGETDFFIIGSECTSKNAWASDDKWLHGPTNTTTLDAGDAFFMWGTHLVPGELEVKDPGTGNGGLYFMIGNSDTAYYRYHVAGSDTLIYDERWICVPIDPTISAARDSTQGTPSGTWSVWGIGANLPTGGPTKGAPLAFGGLRRGRALTCTNGDGTSGYATFDGAASHNDALSRRYGQFQLSGGVYKQQGLFEIGSAATSCDFRDSNRSIVVANTEKVASTFNGFEIKNASSNVEWTGITIKALGTTSPGYIEVVDDATVAIVNCSFIDLGTIDFLTNTTVDGTIFQNCGVFTAGGATIDSSSFIDMGTFTFASGDDVTNSAFENCDQITSTGAVLTGTSISSYAGTASAALLYNQAADPDGEFDNMTFTKGTATKHAIEFGTSAPTSINLRGVTFSGYNAADENTDSAINFLRTSGTTTLNILEGGTTPTVNTTGTHTVNIVVAPVTTTVNVLDENGDDLDGAQVLLEASDGTGDLPYQDTVTISGSGTLATVTHTAHGLVTNDKVKIRGCTTSSVNGVKTITVTNSSTYTYPETTLSGAGAGTITSTGVVISGTTTSGSIADTRSWSVDQPVIGRVRKSTTTPLYVTSPLTGTIVAASGLTITTQMIRDD